MSGLMGGGVVSRALASPSRVRLLEILQDAGEPMGVAELAERLDLHTNTVRSHLVVLVDEGWVEVARDERGRPGRPRQLYTAVQAAEQPQDRSYRFLAQVLAGVLRQLSDEPGREAEEAGRSWGRYLMDRPPPFSRLDGDEVLRRLLGLLDDFGFMPALEDGEEGGGSRVLLHRCPFIGVARDNQEVVCSLHLGLMRGALEELDGGLEATRLLPLVSPSLCVAELHPSAPPTDQDPARG